MAYVVLADNQVIQQMIIIDRLVPQNSKVTSTCPCGQSQIETMLQSIQTKLADWGEKHLKAIKYDLYDDVNMDEVSLFLSYQRALISKSTMCSGCLADIPTENICSRLLTIINR